MKRLSWTWPLLALGCGQEVLELDLVAPDGMASLLLATSDDGDLSLVAYAIEAGQSQAIEPIGRYIGAYPIILTALFYPTPLSSLGLAPGPLELVPEGQALPGGAVVLEAEIRGSHVEPWRPVPELTRPLTDLRIESIPLGRCLEVSGCYQRVDDGFSACNLPCKPPPAVEPPRPPRPFDLGPCTRGWRASATVDGPTACDPWPEGGRQTCLRGYAHFPGGAGCTRVGRPCDLGLYADDLPPGPVRYVDPAAPNGGDGSLATLYNTITRAIANASAGTVVALAKGTFDESVTMRPGITLAGACSETIIAPSTDLTPIIASASGRIQDLTIRAHLKALEVIGAGTGFVADGIDFDGAVWDAVQVLEGATATVSNSRIAATEGSYVGYARLTLDNVSMSRSVGVALFVEGGIVRIRNTAMSDGQPYMDRYGHAINAVAGSTLVIDHLSLDDNRAFGLIVGEGSQARISDSVIRGTYFDQGGAGYGDGVQVFGGATVFARRIHVHHNERFNLFVSDAGSELVLEDALIADPLPSNGVDAGAGILIQGAATASISRTIISRCVDSCVRLTDRAHLSLFDVTISDTTRAVSDQVASSGLLATDRARLVADRLVVQRTGADGISVRSGARADLHNVLVEDTGALECLKCSGICANSGGVIEEVSDTKVVGARAGGLSASGQDTRIRALGIEVRESVKTADCVLNRDLPRFGDGISARDGATLTVERFLSTANEGVGIYVADFVLEGTSLDAKDGEVSFNGTGAEVYLGFDARRIAVDVLYHDNRAAFLGR